MTRPGIAGILFGTEKTQTINNSSDSSDVATSILQLASSYHSKASEPRLNNSVRTVGGVSQPRPGGLNKFKNLGKAAQALELRKAKQDEAKLLDNGIRISAVLWMAEGPGSSKLTEVWFCSMISRLELILQICLSVQDYTCCPCFWTHYLNPRGAWQTAWRNQTYLSEEPTWGKGVNMVTSFWPSAVVLFFIISAYLFPYHVGQM